jgi:transcriptional regulator with XRE-family HTH domain
MCRHEPIGTSGFRLKQLRERHGLTLREVESLSRRLAREKQNNDYLVSRGWLNHVENGEFTPSIYKLYTLSVLYRDSWPNLLSSFGLEVSDIGRDQARFAPERTQPAAEPEATDGETVLVPLGSGGKLSMDRTDLLSRLAGIWGEIPVRLLRHLDGGRAVYGVIGRSDDTMYPILRPGSLVEIDVSRRKLSRATWQDEHDRPIYFIELRDGYICSWCEVRDGHLLAIPHPGSKGAIRRFQHPRDAEIVGQVTGVAMRFVSGRPGPDEPR